MVVPKSFEEANSRVIINTGNVLSVNKKAGQKPTEELYDSIQTTFSEPIFDIEKGEVHRSSDDLHEKINDHERSSIKIGAKLFLNTNSPEYLTEAINTLLKTLNVNCLDNLILAYHPISQDSSSSSIINGDNGENQWNTKSIEDLKLLWKVLEKFAEDKMICQLGIADLDTETLKILYENCKIQPTITQINLAACCVVPPPLQEFCNTHEIQLLTHSDPEVMLTEETMKQLGLEKYEPNWTIRYQVHVKCRGLLTAKGFIIGTTHREKI